jgi:hypothetical protein
MNRISSSLVIIAAKRFAAAAAAAGAAAGAVAVAVTGCASGTPVPADARVETMQTDKMVLRGTAEASDKSPSCKMDALPAKHFVKLQAKTLAHLMLRPALGQPKLELAVLHVTHLESNRTWCVQSTADGSPASIPGEFPYGTYAIGVSEGKTTQPHRYEVVFEKL